MIDDRGGVRDLRERTARAVVMSYEDEYDDYEAYDEGDAYEDEYDEDAYDAEADEPRAQPRYARRRTPMVRRREENTLLSQGVDWAMGGPLPDVLKGCLG